MAHSALKFDSIRPNTCPPDTSALDDAWSDEPPPRDSYVALKAAGSALRALPPPPRLGAPTLAGTQLTAPSSPRCELSYDVWDSPRGTLVLLDVPGVDPEHILVSLGSHAIYVVVDVPEGMESFGVRVGRHEVSVQLPCGVPPDTLDASLSNGVLRIRAPKPAAGPRRLIPIVPDSGDGA